MSTKPSTTTNLPSRPSTPLLRSTSRTSLRSGPTTPSTRPTDNPLTSLEPAFAELSDSMADLEANFMHLQLMHESLSRFNENFASFLYGLNMNAFCVDFPEAPIAESFKRTRPSGRENDRTGMMGQRGGQEGKSVFDTEASFLTTDTSFVDNPPVSSRSSRFETPAPKTPAPKPRGGAVGRGDRGGRGGSVPTRGGLGRGSQTGIPSRGGRPPSGLARAKPRGAR